MTCGLHRGRIILFMVVGEILKAVLGVSCTSVRLIGEGIQKDVRGGFGGIQRLLPLSFHSLFSLLFFFSPSVFIPLGLFIFVAFGKWAYRSVGLCNV